MYECFPDGILVEKSIVFLMSDYFLVEISIVNELHYDADSKLAYQSELASINECL